MPDIEVRSHVVFPARGLLAAHDARRFEQADAEDEGARQLARDLLPMQCADWTALLVRGPDVDLQAHWRSGASVIAFGVDPWTETEAASIEALQRTVVADCESPASGGEFLRSAERRIHGYPAWLVERVPSEKAEAERLRRRQYVVAVREKLLGLVAQSSEADWAAHERDFEALVGGSKLPRPTSECGEDDRLGGLSPGDCMLGRMFGGDEDGRER